MKKRLIGFMFGLTVLFAATVNAVEEAEEMAGAYQDYMEDGISEEAQEAFDQAMEKFEGGENYTAVQLLETQLVAGMNYRILCDVKSEESGNRKLVVTIYKDLNGNCEVTQELKVIEPLNQQVTLNADDDMTAKAAFEVADFNWEDQTLRFDVYQDALYDMVDMARMELYNVVEVDGRYIMVETMEEGETVRRSEDGSEEKVASICINKGTGDETLFIANEGGTWITIGDNDHIGIIKVGEMTLPFSETLTFTDATETPGEKIDVSVADIQSYLNEKKDSYMGQYGPYNTIVETQNGEIVSIARTWMP